MVVGAMTLSISGLLGRDDGCATYLVVRRRPGKAAACPRPGARYTAPRTTGKGAANVTTVPTYDVLGNQREDRYKILKALGSVDAVIDAVAPDAEARGLDIGAIRSALAADMFAAVPLATPPSN